MSADIVEAAFDAIDRVEHPFASIHAVQTISDCIHPLQHAFDSIHPLEPTFHCIAVIAISDASHSVAIPITITHTFHCIVATFAMPHAFDSITTTSYPTAFHSFFIQFLCNIHLSCGCPVQFDHK